MSEISTLISYSGKISRAELARVPTPPATPTHIPIPHIEVVQTLVETLGLRHIGIVGEEFAVSGDGMEMFGNLGQTTEAKYLKTAFAKRGQVGVPRRTRPSSESGPELRLVSR